MKEPNVKIETSEDGAITISVGTTVFCAPENLWTIRELEDDPYVYKILSAKQGFRVFIQRVSELARNQEATEEESK